MANKNIELITETIKTETGLRDDQIVIAQPGGDGYAHVYAVKGDSIVDLGALSYEAWIRQEANYGNLNNKLVTAFAKMAAEKFKDPEKVVPPLSGNPDFFDTAYKVLYEQWKNPQVRAKE